MKHHKKGRKESERKKSEYRLKMSCRRKKNVNKLIIVSSEIIQVIKTFFNASSEFFLSIPKKKMSESYLNSKLYFFNYLFIFV